jgi:hypothetical protein
VKLENLWEIMTVHHTEGSLIDKIKTETAVMKRVLSTVDSWCVTDGVRKEKERLTAALRENHMRIGG